MKDADRAFLRCMLRVGVPVRSGILGVLYFPGHQKEQVKRPADRVWVLAHDGYIKKLEGDTLDYVLTEKGREVAGQDDD